MTVPAFGGLPTLLEVIGRSPHPDEVARAIVEGPGACFGATSAAVLWAKHPHLVILGTHGYRPQEVQGLNTIPLDGDYPLTHSFWEGEVIITPSRYVGERYTSMTRPESRWQRLKERMPDGDHVTAPIVSDGRAIGAYAMNVPASRDWSTLDIAALDALSHALGMWMTHPDSGLPVEPSSPAVDEFSITTRQRQILSLISEGRTNLSISHSLGISLSTVKQDIARLMDLLDAPDRYAAAERAATLGILQTEAL